MKLEPKRLYEATLLLNGISIIASNNRVKEKFTSIGFSDVIVVGVGKHRTARGRWNGASQLVDIPKEVTNIKAL